MVHDQHRRIQCSSDTKKFPNRRRMPQLIDRIGGLDSTKFFSINQTDSADNSVESSDPAQDSRHVYKDHSKKNSSRSIQPLRRICAKEETGKKSHKKLKITASPGISRRSRGLKNPKK